MKKMLLLRLPIHGIVKATTMKAAILILLVAVLVLAGACKSTEVGIGVEPELGNYLKNSSNESSGVILKDVKIKTDICDKEYFSPWYPSHTVKRGDPCLVVSGHIQNSHEENSEIAMYAEGYDEAGEQVAWTLDAAHIAGQIGLHLEYEETSEFTLHLNLSEDTRAIRIFANNYSVTPT